jgi:simple sugar transport system ATP-binding protein
MSDDDPATRERLKFFGPVIALSGVTLRSARRGALPAGRQRRRQEHADQDAGGRASARRGRVPRRRQAGALQLAARGARRGIATVYQDLALVPLMSVARNFFMGREPMRRLFGALPVMDHALAERTAAERSAEMGIRVRDAGQLVGNMSGGEKQCLAIARAIHFGARVLILDEPTAALGVKQSVNVLKLIARRGARHLGHLHHPQRQPRLPDRRPLHAAQSRQVDGHARQDRRLQGSRARHDGRRRRDEDADARPRRRDDLITEPHAKPLDIPAGRRFDLACLGRLAVDLYAQQVGARLEDVASFAKYLGGSSANIAFGAARLGLRAAMISRVGDEQMGRFLVETLQREGCDTSPWCRSTPSADRAGHPRPEGSRHLPAAVLPRELRRHGDRPPTPSPRTSSPTAARC